MRKPSAASARSKDGDDGAAHRSSSAPAIAGEGDHPAKQGGGGGACLNATQESPRYADFKFAQIFLSCVSEATLLLLFFCTDNEAPSHAPPPPRFARFASSSGPPPPLSRWRISAPVLATRLRPSYATPIAKTDCKASNRKVCPLRFRALRRFHAQETKK